LVDDGEADGEEADGAGRGGGAGLDVACGWVWVNWVDVRDGVPAIACECGGWMLMEVGEWRIPGGRVDRIEGLINQSIEWGYCGTRI
jgi:hypothetical protein